MKQIVWTSQMVDSAREQISNGFVLKRIENPFYDNTPGLRKSGLTFKMTPEEVDEYIKCKMDVHYFAETYCWVKGEKGDPVKLKLRDYQKEMLDNFFNNRFNILMASRQTGKCFVYNTQISIYDKNLDKYFDIKAYELLYKFKKNKNFFDWLKYFTYNLIDLLERRNKK
jgi:hypothetical protein